MTLTEYEGYEIVGIKTPSYAIYDPRQGLLDPPLMVKATLPAAKAWIEAYRAGYQWAVDEKLAFDAKNKEA